MRNGCRSSTQAATTWATCPTPGVLEEGGTVNSLAVDPASGDLYLGFFRDVSSPESKPNVFKLDPAGEELCTIGAHDPSAVAVGGEGEVYVVDGRIFGTPPTPREVLRFDSACGGREVLFGPEEAEAQFTANPTGIAVSTACRSEAEAGESDLIAANPDFSQSFVKIFGPPPNGSLCPPPPAPPLITDQLAVSVGREGATVRAKINPRFWPDTAYRVQYASPACLGEAEDWGAGCVRESPAGAGVTLSERTVSDALPTKEVFLGGLEPGAPYRYRFVAQSSGGGPVYGQGGGEEEGGSYREAGAAGAFRTYPAAAPPESDCPNEAYRTGPAAQLPDCRAYEQVSPGRRTAPRSCSPARRCSSAPRPTGKR